jgi:hypothetical protein
MRIHFHVLAFVLALLFLTAASTSFAQSLPPGAGPQIINSSRWPQPWAQVDSLDSTGTHHSFVFYEALQRKEWSDVDAKLAQLLKRKAVTVSPEYVAFRMGASALVAPALYGKDPKALNTKFDGIAHPPAWLTLIQPRDQAETNCLALSYKAGKASGCGDQWQGGITNSKLECYQGKTYLKCHLRCIEKIYSRQMATAPGACEASK